MSPDGRSGAVSAQPVAVRARRTTRCRRAAAHAPVTRRTSEIPRVGSLAIIIVEGLTKRFGRLTAVDSLSFEVPDGELFALLGTNGAGKTTTISCMVTLLSYDAGRITIDELEPGRDDQRIRERIHLKRH